MCLQKLKVSNNNNSNNETVEHVISACLLLAKEQHIKRHDRVCAELHCNTCKEVGVKLDNEHRCKHVTNW